MRSDYYKIHLILYRRLISVWPHQCKPNLSVNTKAIALLAFHDNFECQWCILRALAKSTSQEHWSIVVSQYSGHPAP